MISVENNDNNLHFTTEVNHPLKRQLVTICILHYSCPVFCTTKMCCALDVQIDDLRKPVTFCVNQ